jgi:hypothetical protein
MPQDPQEPMGPPLVDDPDVDGRDEDDDIEPEETPPKPGVIPEDEQVDPVL